MMEIEYLIREKSQKCKQLFQRCLKIVDIGDDDWLEQKSAEFNWWASGLNADKTGPGSLDARLRLRPDIRDVVADLLKNLMAALARSQEIAIAASQAPGISPEDSNVEAQYSRVDGLERTPSPWSDLSDSSASPSTSHHESENIESDTNIYRRQKSHIEINLEILIRIYASIKTSGIKFRHQRADNELKKAEVMYQSEKARLGEHAVMHGSDPSIGKHERFRRFLTRRILQNGYTESLIRRLDCSIHRFLMVHGSDKEDHPYVVLNKKLIILFQAYLYDPARLTPIQRRLIDANVVRRNRLTYAGNADARYVHSRHVEESQHISHGNGSQAFQQTQSIEEPVDQSVEDRSHTRSASRPTSKKSFASQAATGMESNFSITKALAPKTAKSAATYVSARLDMMDYPKCPTSKNSFQCPYCPLILSDEYTKKPKWRAHVAQDLSPYVCLFESCEYADDMYASTYEWMSHMAKCHSVVEWVCTECFNHPLNVVTDTEIPSFDDPKHLKEHLVSLHPSLGQSETEQTILGGKRLSGIQRVACPLCRSGLVVSDEDVVLLPSPSQEVGLVQLEDDEHIASHLHEFSLYALPNPDLTETGADLETTASKSTISTRPEITFRALDATGLAPGGICQLYNPDELLNMVQQVKLGIEYMGLRGFDISSLLRQVDWIIMQGNRVVEDPDQESFLLAMNQCQVTMSELVNPAPGIGATITGKLHTQLQGHLDKLVLHLGGVDVKVKCNHYAILIGIDAYPEKYKSSLKGCVRDTQQIISLLEQQPFHINIQTLTATQSSDSSITGPVEDPARLPTDDNVIKAFRDLTSAAQSGDYIYIHYSGHGTRIAPTAKAFSNQHTGDLALALLGGENGDEVRPLGGYRLAVSLNAMVLKGLVVTLVLDCCFAASIYRLDRPDIRFLRIDPDLASAYFADKSVSEKDEETPDSGYRDISMLPNWLINPNGYALLAACGPHEEAGEIIHKGESHGALSHFLNLSLRDGGLNRKHKNIFYRLSSKFRAHSVQQNPALYGNKDQGFFGENNITNSRSTVLVVRNGQHFVLQAGQAHGVSDGDEFILYPSSVLEKNEAFHTNLIKTAVERAGPLTSLLQLGDDMAATSEDDWVAEPQTRRALGKFSVSFSNTMSPQNIWPEALIRYGMTYAGEHGLASWFHVQAIGNEYKIMTRNGEGVMNLPSLSQSTTNADDVAAVLEHLARYEVVKSLSNPSVEEYFRTSFDISIVRAGDAFGPDILVDVEQDAGKGAMFELKLQNHGAKVLYLYILDLGPLWQIEDIYCGSYAVVPPYNQNERFMTGSFSKKFRTMVPDELRQQGIEECYDTLKVLVTSQPTSFDLLELPKIGHALKKRSPADNDRSGGSSVEQWIAFNFPLKTSPAAELRASKTR